METAERDLVQLADRMRRIEVVRAAEELMHEYQRLVDAKDIAGLGGLVTDDVELVRLSDGGVGREVFLDLYRAFAASDVAVAHHMVTNIEVAPVEAVDQERYRIDATFLAITTHDSGGARMVWGRYSNDMVEDHGRWRLAAKRIRVARIASLPEAMLVAADASSFDPLPGQ